MAGHDDRLLTTKEVAAKVRRSPRTLEDWRLDDYGPPYSRNGAGVVYRESDVDEWIEARRVVPVNA